MKKSMMDQCDAARKLHTPSSETVIDIDDATDVYAPLHGVETERDGFDTDLPEPASSNSEDRSHTPWKIAAGLAAGAGAGLLMLSQYLAGSGRPGKGSHRPHLRDELGGDERDLFDYINGTVRALQVQTPVVPLPRAEDSLLFFSLALLNQSIASLPDLLMPQAAASSALLPVPSGGKSGAGHAFAALPLRQDGSVEAGRQVQQPEAIGAQELQAEIALIDSLWISFDFLSTNKASFSSARHKRRAETPAPIAEKNMKREIEKAVSTKKYPVNFISLVEEIYRRSEHDDIVKNTSPDSRDAVLLLTSMTYFSTAMKRHVAYENFNASYNFLYLGLKDSWRIARRVTEGETPARLIQYENHIPAEKWSSREKSKGEITLVDHYFQKQNREWKEHDLRSDDRVAIHTWSGVKVYTMTDLWRNRHVGFIGGQEFFSHFIFDHTGLPDAILDDFVGATRSGDFIKESAAVALHEMLLPITSPPLYFSLESKLQELDDSVLGARFSGAENRADGKRIKEAMIATATARISLVELEQVSLASADGLILSNSAGNFSGMNIEKLVAADYVYCYDDADGMEKCDTATLAEYLHRETDATNVVIAGRENVKMRWPFDFNSKLRSYLENEASRAVEKIYTRLGEDLQASIYQEWLSHKIPTLQSMLESIVDEISAQENLPKGTIRLSDTAVFEYYHMQLLNSGLAATRVDKPIPQYKSFSVEEILCGEKRKWQAKNIYFRLREDVSSEYFTSEKISRSFLQKLQDVDAQKRLTDIFLDIRGDAESRQVFSDYEQLMEARAPADRAWRYGFANAPMLILYAQNDFKGDAVGQFFGRLSKPGTSPNHQPENRITVFSVRDGSVRDFANFEEITKMIREDENFRTFLRAHFLVDFDLDSNFTLLNLYLRSGKIEFEGHKVDFGNVEFADVDLFDRMIAFEIMNVDKVITSHPEANIRQLFQVVQQISFFASFAFMFANPALGLVLGTLLNVVPKAVEAYVVNDNRERRELLEQAAWEMVIQLGTSAGFSVVKQAFKSGFTKWLSRNVGARLKRLRVPKGGSNLHGGKKLPMDTPQYLKKLRANQEINGYIRNPFESCAAVLEPLGKIMKDDGFTEIVYRGMLIWPDHGSLPPITHFVVLGKKSGSTLVFDLTAGQFKTLTRKLNKPLIVSEGVWKKKYKFMNKEAVIRYQDFPSAAGAERAFDPIRTMSYTRTDLVEGTTLLTVPKK